MNPKDIVVGPEGSRPHHSALFMANAILAATGGLTALAQNVRVPRYRHEPERNLWASKLVQKWIAEGVRCHPKSSVDIRYPDGTTATNLINKAMDLFDDRYAKLLCHFEGEEEEPRSFVIHNGNLRVIYSDHELNLTQKGLLASWNGGTKLYKR